MHGVGYRLSHISLSPCWKQYPCWIHGQIHKAHTDACMSADDDVYQTSLTLHSTPVDTKLHYPQTCYMTEGYAQHWLPTSHMQTMLLKSLTVQISVQTDFALCLCIWYIKLSIDSCHLQGRIQAHASSAHTKLAKYMYSPLAVQALCWHHHQ